MNIQTDLKDKIVNSVESNLPELYRIRTYLYENPEVGGKEEKSSRILIDTLREHGFTVTEDFHKIPYCLKARSIDRSDL